MLPVRIGIFWTVVIVLAVGFFGGAMSAFFSALMWIVGYGQTWVKAAVASALVCFVSYWLIRFASYVDWDWFILMGGFRLLDKPWVDDNDHLPLP